MAETYQFGDTVVDLSLRQIRRSGDLQQVQAKVFELLCFLIENRDRVLSKDDIQNAIWPGTIVTESSLSRAIMKARRAIGDSDQSLIVNVHGVGYRFAAELSDAVDSDAAVPPRSGNRLWSVGLGLLLAVVCFVVFDYWRGQAEEKLEEDFRQIAGLIEIRNFVAAGQIIETLREAGVQDSRLEAAFAESFDLVNIASRPAGATVTATRLKVADDIPFVEKVRELGETPIVQLSIERATWLLDIRKEGFAPEQRILSSEHGRETINLDAEVSISVQLIASEDLPEGMVHVPGGNYVLVSPDAPANMTADLEDFFIDRFEVSNADYLEFVQQGGYQRPEFWTQDLHTLDGASLEPDEVATTFSDRSGMPGPLGWVDRLPRPGQERWPVANVSWYEADAYCRFAGKQLPTIFQWEKAARNGLATNYEGWVMPWGYARPGEGSRYRANYQSTAPEDVDRYPAGISQFGAYAMAGNVKEWLLTGKGEEKIVSGGSFQDPSYVFGQLGSFHPATRLPTMGFRCASQTDSGLASLPANIAPPAYTPVDRDAYRRILDFYRYDKLAANATIVETVETADWTRQQIELDGPDPENRLLAFLWLPRNTAQPFQTIIYVPGADAYRDNTVAQSAEITVGGNIRSGRAAFAVVMRGMVGREFKDGYSWPAKGSVEQLDLMVEQATELRLGVDYLVSRDEIDADAMAYVGLSWGAASALAFAALEDRTRAVVFIGGGIDERSLPALPEAAPYNFAPYIGKPTLLLNGRHDEEHPWPSRGQALWNLLQEPKELRLLDGVGHLPPAEYRTPAINAFLDTHLGGS